MLKDRHLVTSQHPVDNQHRFNSHIVDYRLETARIKCNAETINIKDEKAVDEIHELTSTREADICIDAVVMETDRSIIDKLSTIIKLEKGTINALKMAFSAVRRGGFISVLEV